MPLISTKGGASAVGFGLTGASGPSEFLVDYLVVGGGGSGGLSHGGGGAGGYRTSFPLGTGGSQITVPVGSSYTITIGAGGTTPPSPTSGPRGQAGTASTFSTITSAGGGEGGGGPQFGTAGGSGGSGGGAGRGPGAPGGVGNTPPTSPPQGNDGGPGNNSPQVAGSGGGAGGAGSQSASAFGPGLSNSISGGSVTYAAGAIPGFQGFGDQPSVPGGTNTGNGAQIGYPTGGSGGPGIVIIRGPAGMAAKASASPGSNTVTTAPNGDTVVTFIQPGTFSIS